MSTDPAGPTGFWRQGIFTSLNALLYTISLGRYLWLEGRRSGQTWHNWTHGQKHVVDPYLLPETEEDLVQAVKDHPRLRVLGAGHSFNAGVMSTAALSLDGYTGLVSMDRTKKQARFRAGTRVRDVNRILDRHGLAIIALPSHDAQTLAGILSTDVHGTGLDVGFVSQSVVRLRLVDGRGQIHEVKPEDDLFRAAIGGIGGVGVITEVVIQCVDAFRIRQRTVLTDQGRARTEMMHILDSHQHVSFYLFPFTRKMLLHTWDRTGAKMSVLGVMRETTSITLAALSAAWIGDFLAWSKLLPGMASRLLRTQKSSTLVMKSYLGFNRTIYHLHQELEFTVPVERTWEVAGRMVKIYEDLYQRRRMPFTLIELRFTPAGHVRSLIGPGSGQEVKAHINLVCNQSPGFAEFFAAAEEVIRTTDARPHLGKWCRSWTHDDLARLFGDDFLRFRELVQQHDPEERFGSDFTRRLFGPETEEANRTGPPGS